MLFLELKILLFIKWYIDLFNLNKNEIKDEIHHEDFSSWKSETEQSSNIENDRRNIGNIENKKIEILTNEEFNKLDESNKTNYKKYFILGSILIISGVIWYYWNDIKPGDTGNAIVEKIRSFRSWFNNDTNNINNNNNGNNQINIPTNINSPIELTDNNQPTSYNLHSKDKRVLTSPSLENLNDQAESSWGEGRSSPNSDSSDRTITQASTSSSLDLSSSNQASSSSNLPNLISNNWRNKLDSELNSKMNFVESCFNSKNELNLQEGLKLSDYYAFIINEYNKEIDTYNFMKTTSNYNDNYILNGMKESIYYFRKWISDYHDKIFPTSNVTIEIGNISDYPKILTKDIV